MAESRDAETLFWVEPEARGVFPLDGLVVSRSLAKTTRGDAFEVVADRAFDAVMAACADRDKTWINAEIVRLYSELHARGHAHSVEAYQDGELVGVFPEGIHTIAHLHSVSKIRTFRTGFARIALEAKAPIIPIAVIGQGERNLPTVPPWLVKPFFDHPEFQSGVSWTYYKSVFVRIGKPMDLSGYYGEVMDKALISQISGKVRRVIIKLYNGEDLDRFLTGEVPFDIAYDRV